MVNSAFFPGWIGILNTLSQLLTCPVHIASEGMGKVYQYKQEPDKPASFWTVEWNERVMLKS